MEHNESFDFPCENDHSASKDQTAKQQIPVLPMIVTDEVVRYYSPMVYRIAMTKTLMKPIFRINILLVFNLLNKIENWRRTAFHLERGNLCANISKILPRCTQKSNNFSNKFHFR